MGIGLCPAGADYNPIIKVLKDFRGGLCRLMYQQRAPEVIAQPAKLSQPSSVSHMVWL